MHNDVKLIMVTANNNNKFYNMHDNGDGTLTSTWGRVGTSGTETIKPIKDWDKIYREKQKKGYVDVSENTAVTKGYAPESDPDIEKLLTHLLNISRQYVSERTDIGHLTESAIAENQAAINELANLQLNFGGIENFKAYCKNSKRMDTSTTRAKYNEEVRAKFNEILLRIWTISPRKISDVRSALLRTDCIDNPDRMQKYVDEEQSILDNIILQSKATNNADGSNTISQALGFRIEKASADEFKYVVDKYKKEADKGSNFKVKNVYKIYNDPRDNMFNEYLESHNLENSEKHVKMYYHGTGPENVISIMANGLVIRPANAAYCGSAFGDGIYSAPSPNKSWNYTRYDGSRKSRWMLINAVVYGIPFNCEHNDDKIDGGIKIYNLNTENFNKIGKYNCVHAHASGSSYIRRDEVIVYNNSQVTCRFLVELDD